MKSGQPRAAHRRQLLRRASVLGACIAAALATLPALAQEESGAETAAGEKAVTTMDKIVVTGSRIKRVDGETALPVEVITREEISKRGVTTAAELVRTLSANTAPLTDGASITDGTSGQRGFNGANLRGIGVSSTLILLNGRRLANFASPGDNAGVDLNNIPAAAIQRVEVLKDGASAIYGTDAIGGVINFITRSDYQGVDLSVSAADTDEGGADKQTFSISAGTGNLESDHYNVFGVLDVQHLGALRSSQREFIRKRPLAERLPALMSSNTYPANIDINSDQRNALIAAGLLPAGSTRNRINPSSPDCNPPATVYAPEGPGGPTACSYDYMEDTELYPDSDRVSFLGRAIFKINDEHRLFAEVSYAEARSTYRLSPNPQRIRNLPVSILPEPYRTALSAEGLPSTFSGIRYRMTEAGNRTNEVTSTGQRLVFGANGMLGNWDYEVALSRSQNDAVDKYVDGYVLFDQFDAAVRDGTINPFGPSSADGLALLDSITVNDEARKSKGITQGVDFSLTRSLASLGGGDLGIAVGGEFRRETQDFTPSDLLVSNNIAGDRDNGAGVGSSTDLVATRDGRNITSAYVELNAPFTSTFEMQAALRYDRYSGVGSSVNPKIGLRWQPREDLLVRGSAGTGFRAPSISDLSRPTTFGTTSSFLTDPQCVDVEGSIDFCTDQWPVERRSNPDLKPEKSRQFSLGVVYEPTQAWNVGVDYWNILKRDVISTLGEQIIVENPDRYNGTYIERDEDGFITNILLQKENQGRLKTSGIDLSTTLRGEEGDYGRFGFTATSTYVLEYKRQFGPLEPYRSNLGVFLNDQVIQRWRHRIAFSWDKGPFGVTLANTYSSGYRDQNNTYDPVTDSLLPEHDVKPYSLWDLSTSWTATEKFRIRAGVLNLFNRAPPFSNQSYYFLASYDPTYTDPRGRSYYLSLEYKFR
ncbi:MAG: TonB-dependent receptor [Xanthomonadales bacterium]|nr:TonB-dependent receptor [Xanthomonadales bacterium]